MSEILEANIFFFITSVAVIVFTVLVSVAVYYVIKILQSVRRIVDRIDAGSETIAEDISELREYIASGSLISQVIGLFIRRKRPVKKRTLKEE